MALGPDGDIVIPCELRREEALAPHNLGLGFEGVKKHPDVGQDEDCTDKQHDQDDGCLRHAISGFDAHIVNTPNPRGLSAAELR